jgi:hypothetical protein
MPSKVDASPDFAHVKSVKEDRTPILKPVALKKKMIRYNDGS